MKLLKTKIKGPLLIKSEIFKDKRGYLRETFRNNLLGKIKFPFDVMSFSKKNVLRGLHIQTESGSRGAKIFLLKWGISIKFFKKYFLKSDTKYDGPLKEPSKNFDFYFNFFKNKLNYLYIRYIYNFRNKHNLINNEIIKN